jgi:ribonucrease Y
MEEPNRRGANGDAAQGPNERDERERADSPENDPVVEGPTEEISTGEVPADDAGGNGSGVGVANPGELRRRLRAKDRHMRELYDELVAARLAADEARARMEAGESRVRDLEEERAQLKERLHAFEEEEHRRRRRREGQDRRVERLEREIERREAAIRRLEDLLDQRKNEMDAYGQEARNMVSRKEVALEDALRRVEGLQRDLEERENETAELRATIDNLRAELDLEYELRRRMAEPANRLRAGIDLFNESEHIQSVDSISKSLGRPEVHVALADGDKPPVILTFTWDDITWRVYAANPDFAVEEPRVYQMGAGEDLSGVNREPSNARIGPGGRVLLGL